MQRNLTTLGGTLRGKGRRELEFGELSLNQGPGLVFWSGLVILDILCLKGWGVLGVCPAEVAAGRCDVDVRWQVSDCFLHDDGCLQCFPLQENGRIQLQAAWRSLRCTQVSNSASGKVPTD